MAHAMALEQSPALIRRTVWLMPLAAGIFVGVLVFDAMPAAAASLGGWAFVWAFAGLALMAASSRLSRGGFGWATWVATAGVGVHACLEGLAAGTGAGLGVAGSVLLLAGLVVHLIPEGAALFAILSEAGVSTGKALARCAMTWGFVLAGFAAGQSSFGDQVAGRPMGVAMGLAAGTFVYLAWVMWQHRVRASMTPWLSAAAGLLWIAAAHL